MQDWPEPLSETSPERVGSENVASAVMSNSIAKYSMKIWWENIPDQEIT